VSRPTLFRTAVARLLGSALALLLTAGLPAIGAVPARAATHVVPSRTAAFEADLLVQINELRQADGLAPLTPSSGLRRAAAEHSAAMAARGFFAHDSFGGGRFWHRLRPHYPRRGEELWSVGENLLWATPHVDAAEALRMWLRSSTHRRTLLRARWREIGLAAIHVRSAPGFFGGQEVTIVTADFGVRGPTS
jgi:uncharacterized protein YkwD